MKTFTVIIVWIVGCIFNLLDARVYFLHIPKTGGTTLRLLIEQQLSCEEIYPFKNYKSAKRSVHEELVSGHFPYWFCKNIDCDFETSYKITILRNPIDRYLSFLRAKKKADRELSDLESVFNLRFFPDNKYKEGLIDNAYCRYLASKNGLEGVELLESAKATLLTLDAVVFYDHFERDIIDLFHRFHIDLNRSEIPRINITQDEQVSDELLERVRQVNELDLQLYEYAKKHYTSKNTLYLLRKPSYERILKKTSRIDYTFNLPLNGNGWTYRDTLGNEMSSYPTYRWVMDYPAEIYFHLETEKDYRLLFNAYVLTNEIIPRVCVNGYEIELHRLDNENFSLYQGDLKKEFMTENFTKITFFSTKSAYYWEIYPSHYNRNHPPLSFALNRIQIIQE